MIPVQKVSFNQSPAVDCFRLIHDGKKVLELFQSTGVTRTVNQLYCGNNVECQAEIVALGLTPLRTA